MELGSGTVGLPVTVNVNWLGNPVITPVMGSWLNVVEMMLMLPELAQKLSCGEVLFSPYSVVQIVPSGREMG